MTSSLAFYFYHDRILSSYDNLNVQDVSASLVGKISSIVTSSPAPGTVPADAKANVASDATTTTTQAGAPVQNKPNTVTQDEKPKVVQVVPKATTQKKKTLKPKAKKPKKTLDDDLDDDDEDFDDDLDDEDDDEELVSKKKKITKKVTEAPKASPPSRKRLTDEISQIKKEALEKKVESDDQGEELPMEHFSKMFAKPVKEITDAEIENMIRSHYVVHGHLEHMFDALNEDEQERMADYLHEHHETVLKIMTEHQELVQKPKEKVPWPGLEKKGEQAPPVVPPVAKPEVKVTQPQAPVETKKAKTPFNLLLKAYNEKNPTVKTTKKPVTKKAKKITGRNKY
jgi:hypothetical protein